MGGVIQMNAFRPRSHIGGQAPRAPRPGLFPGPRDILTDKEGGHGG